MPDDYFDRQPPTVTEFLERLSGFEREIGCNGKTTGSHSYPSTVEFRDTEGNTYKVVDIEPETHMGCGCWVGMTFRLKRDPDR